MREIKFRAWEEDMQKMFYKVGIIDGSYFVSFDGIGYDEVGNYKTLKVMQYTGLKDENGVEIYEGDILKITHEDGFHSVHQVKYFANSDYPAFDLDPYLDCDSNGLSHVMACCVVEVIGNIYENPKLINVT